MNNKNDKKITVALVVMFIIGLSLLLYPSVSEYWNSIHASRAIIAYSEKLESIDQAECERIWQDAVAYNQKLSEHQKPAALKEEEYKAYYQQLNIAGDGVIGYIDLPSVHMTLPIYHGTSEATLQVAIGHLEWTSLPVGGKSTHSVLSGHRGLPSARLFTDIDKLKEGDVFILNILNQTLTYEVDQILIVLPEEVESLLIVDGEDYCTLTTCTPYGINTHRLLVRGHRVDNAIEYNTHISSDALQVNPLLVALFIAIPVLLLLVIYLYVSSGIKNRRKKKISGLEVNE